jgi:hypothetical protein
MEREGEAFLFEKKKQKTFTMLSRDFPEGPATGVHQTDHPSP